MGRVERLAVFSGCCMDNRGELRFLTYRAGGDCMNVVDFISGKVTSSVGREAKIAAEGKILLRIVEGAAVALHRPTDESSAELLIPRPDLFQYSGGYGWGYGGSGPQNLSYAIVGKVFENEYLDKSALSDKAMQLLEKLVSGLSGDSEYDFPVSVIKRLLA